MQVTIAELKTRESAEQYLKIEQNTEYLTHLVRYSTNKRRVYLKTDGSQYADLKSIAALTVQLSYMLFTCYVKQVTILISRRFLVLNPMKREVNPEISCEYIMEKDFLTLREEEQMLILQNYERHEFATSDMRAYGKYALSYVRLMLQMVKPQLQKLKQAHDKMLAKQFLNLQSVRYFLEARLHSIEHPRIVILSFQQSEIFREHSILVKIMNNSIFSAIKNSKFKSIFTQICSLEYSLSRSKDKNKSFLQAYSLEIEAVIEELMKTLIKYDIIRVDQSINNTQEKPNSTEQLNKGVHSKNIGPGGNKFQAPQANQHGMFLNEVNKPSQQTSKPYVLGDVEDAHLPDRKYFCKIQLIQKPWRQFSARIYQSLKFQAFNNYNTSEQNMEDESKNKQLKDSKQLPNSAKNEFVIEFTPVKGLLVVKYITPIELNIENTDFVMFQCNNIAYHWSQVSMELVERSVNKSAKKKERYLALKTITHLHIADRPLFKLLLMLDLVMLCAKIAEPELKKSIIKAQDYNRIQSISLKVNHMINLFIRKIERYYKILSQSENAKNKMM